MDSRSEDLFFVFTSHSANCFEKNSGFQWLTKGLLVSIRRKQWLYKTQILNGNFLEKDQFKMYSNTLNKIKQLSKKMYYHNEVETNKNNPKRMWNVLRTVLPNGKKQVTHEIPKLIYKGTQIEETNKIPEIFDSLFQLLVLF